MSFITLDEIEQREPIPGFRGRFVHSAQMTFAHWEIQANALLPEHSHPHEQVANVLDGRFELTISGDTRVLDSGSVAIIPSHALHSGRAITHCRIVDVFYPIREDYRT
jgi:quercetin dioxygenase-like cupin family protein